MKNILLLGTGGTIASVPSEDGLVPALSGEEIIRLVPKLKGLCTIDYKELFNLDSSNLEPKHWQIMAKAVEENYEKYDGFVITHGTDTMAYTAAALSFMLENCKKPVVLTGAQLPIEAKGSDAPANVLHAFMTACSEAVGVILTFGDRVISGFNAKKMSTEDFNGFISVNEEALGTIEGDKITWNYEAMAKEEDIKGKFTAEIALEEKVAVVKLIPGSKADILEYYADNGYKGIVLESFGAGGVPNAENNWLPMLEKVIKKGVTVVCATQCIFDGVDLHKYPIGSLAEKLGARSAGRYTIEAATTGLMHELGKKC